MLPVTLYIHAILFDIYYFFYVKQSILMTALSDKDIFVPGSTRNFAKI